ncbi:hypothetical protein [Novosphingobium sp. B 225]|uniref:hypothetical protein n=1 Tax=Novosphingobium sp. B 225 TaxID=1961849 RepID=UPI000B4A7391|nr:hypothetical protein [Novosphingobium sp. B 225]
MADDAYLYQGVNQQQTISSVLVSSSKYLNSPKLRDWVARSQLKKGGLDFPGPAEMYELLPILDELRDFDRIEALFTEERRTNPRLDQWIGEGFVSSYKLDAMADLPADSIGGTLYAACKAGNYGLQIVPWTQPKTQFQFFNMRAGQTHDFEHILCGGGFNYLGELLPYWMRLSNIHRYVQNEELVGELNLLSIFGMTRILTRSVLHYPAIWPKVIQCIEHGLAIGRASEPLWMAKFEDVWHLSVAEARTALGVVGAVDIESESEGLIYEGKLPYPMAQAAE